MDKALVSQHGYVNSRAGQKSSYHGVMISDFGFQEMYGPGGSREMQAVVVITVPFDDISPKELISWLMETFPVFCNIQNPMNVLGPAGVRFFYGDSAVSARCIRFWKQKDRYAAQLVFSLGKGSPFYDMSIKKIQSLLDGWAQTPN